MKVTREQFDLACEAVWSEIEYQNNLPIRTESDEAKDIPGFLTLGRRYLRSAEDKWSDNAGIGPSKPFLRKLAAIFIRAMIYVGFDHR
jgi:hypothetical protein